jgi:hypothetical protein
LTVIASLVVLPGAALAADTGGAVPRQVVPPDVEPALPLPSLPLPSLPGPLATVPGTVAKVGADGLARAPQAAPPAVQRAIWAANQLQDKPYRYGGGHGSFLSRGYDCSGAVSFLLRGGELLESPLDSGRLMRWGARGRGDWITVYANRGHAFAVIAGLRLDTSAAGDPGGARGPRWRPVLRRTKGFRARHPEGL